MSSFLNCHMIGLHSLSVGRTDDGKMIRMFIADENHTLWQNSSTNFAQEVQSLAFHNHKSDITLIPLTGLVYNMSMQRRHKDEPNFVFAEFNYHSAIVDKNAGYFVKTHVGFVIGVKATKISKPLLLKAEDLHTIYVPKGTTASWMVIEGDDAHEGMIAKSYSASDLSDWSADGLYQEPTDQQVKELKQRYLLG